MNSLLTLALMSSVPVARTASPIPAPVELHVRAVAHKGGQWYFAETGHAVYCYGPVMTITQAHGSLQRVATFCQGDRSMVPLKD